MATVPATAAESAPRTLSCARNSWLANSRIAVGTIAYVTSVRMRSIAVRSSERVSVNRRASSAKRTAYAARPTRVARYRPEPAATNDPDNTSSPGDFKAASDSPVNSDSSTSNPEDSSTSPSTMTWSPGSRSRTSSRTTCATATSRSVSSRKTRAFGAVKTESRSNVRFARSSCTIPISAFAISTKPNSASRNCPTSKITRSIAPSSALKRVSRFARTICVTVRVGADGTSFARPVATRSATSAEVRPRSDCVCM
jgi:hypothetical protein